MDLAAAGQHHVQMGTTESRCQELLRRCRDGDAGAFDALVLGAQEELRLFVAARAYAVELVDTVMQDTFIRVHAILDEHEDGRPVLPWLRGIAHNCLREELRRRTRHRRRFASAGAQLEALLAHENLEHADANDGWADARIARLTRCLDRLPPSSRRLVYQYYVEDCPLTCLAQRFRRKASALASLLQRIRATLRDCMAHGETA
jgi:RNA polymerase sigma factor (sigma-70 family)